MVAQIYFYIFGVIALLCGLGVLTARHPITGAVNLVGVMLALAGIYAVNNAPFLGIVQILVYAGAIMMLVVFVIMVLNGARDNETPRGGGLPAILGFAVAAALWTLIAFALSNGEPLTADPDAPTATAESIGQTLFDFSGPGWFVLFEVIGLVLLTALAGAVMLAKRSLRTALPVGDQDQGAAH